MNNCFLWIFDVQSFFIKDVKQVSSYEINDDEECSSKSLIYISNSNINAQEKDIIFLKENNVKVFVGVIENIENADDKTLKITVSNIMSMFDEKIELNNEELISENGIEDFLFSQITANYTIGVYALNYIRVNVLSHNKLNIGVENENGIYNLATFCNNCKKLYDLEIEFKMSDDNKYLDIYIYKKENEESSLIDLNLLEKEYIKSYYSSTILTCVKVLTDTQTYTLYLKNDRTTTENPTDPDIIFGKRTTIYTSDYNNAKQEALNQFKANRYEHYFSFRSNKEYNINQKITIKTLNNDILDSYISAKKYNGNGFFEYKCGNLRVDFIDKFLKEKR